MLHVFHFNRVRYNLSSNKISLKHFGFSLAYSAATLVTAGTTATTVVTKYSVSAVPTPMMSQCSSLTAVPTRRRCFSSNWGEGHE